MVPTLSIIIPTLNEEKYLPKLLKSIKKQDFKDYEIIVADYNSKDKTRKIAKRFGCRITKGGRPAVGRNNGAEIAKGDILLFLDADVVLPNYFLSKTLNEFRKKGLYAATCFSAPDSRNLIDHFFYLIWNVFMWIRQFSNPVAPGYCIFAKKEAHNSIKGFNETLFLAEDHDYVKRISRFGKFRVISSWITNSVRRIEKEGRLGIAWKYVFVALYRIFKGEVKKDIYKYEFGKFD